MQHPCCGDESQTAASVLEVLKDYLDEEELAVALEDKEGTEISGIPKQNLRTESASRSPSPSPSRPSNSTSPLRPSTSSSSKNTARATTSSASSSSSWLNIKSLSGPAAKEELPPPPSRSKGPTSAQRLAERLKRQSLDI
jgi:hypothetical protein